MSEEKKGNVKEVKSVRLFNLNQKLFGVNFALDKNELIEEQKRTGAKPEEMQNLIKSEVYKKVVDYIINTLELKIEDDKINPDELHIHMRGYVLNERDMDNVILEICELEDDQREILISACKKSLGINN